MLDLPPSLGAAFLLRLCVIIILISKHHHQHPWWYSSSLFYATWLVTCNSGKTRTFLTSTLTSQNPQPHSTRLKVGNQILKSPWDTPREKKTTYGTPRTSLKDFEELHISLMTPNHSHDLTSSIIINHQSSSLLFIPKKSWPVCRHILSHTHTFLCKGLSL